MPDELQLPELGRSLRAFGAPRDAAGEAAHAAVFTPLLDARALAATSGLGGALSAFRGQALAVRIAARAADVARQGEGDAARARARAAQARELVEPLRAALEALDRLGADVLNDEPSSPAWRAWIGQLALVFRVADDACRGLARLLAQPSAAPAPRRWRGGPAR